MQEGLHTVQKANYSYKGVVDQSLQTPEIQSSANFIYYKLYYKCVEKTKLKEKVTGNGSFKKLVL